MNRLLGPIATVVLAACSAPNPSTSIAGGGEPTCAREEVTGSRLPSQVCRTQQDVEANRREVQRWEDRPTRPSIDKTLKP
jgi:hypothetical protein